MSKPTADDFEKTMRIGQGHGHTLLVDEFQIEGVEVLPHLRGDNLTDGATVFTGRGQATQDGIGVVAIEGQESDHGLLAVIRASFFKEGLIAGRHD